MTRTKTASAELNPICRSDVALKGMLALLLRVMQQQRNGVIEGDNGERLHDYRVAVRRSRALLGQLPQLLPKRMAERYGEWLATLGNLTTPLRDLDVLLLKFDNYLALLPAAIADDLAPARQLLAEQRRQVRQTVVAALQTTRYNRAFSRWHSYMLSDVAVITQLTNARRPIKALADERIWRLYQKALRQGRAITATSAATDLHTLRKTCKKLRYLIDALQSLYPQKELSHIITVLKKLQDHLGEFQDLCVHRQLFATLRQLTPIEAQCDKALDKLQHKLEHQQEKLRKKFHAVFRTFASKKHHHSFKRLFKPCPLLSSP